MVLQHVDEENAYLCGYLKIKNLTDEYPEMVICSSKTMTIHSVVARERLAATRQYTYNDMTTTILP